jgi:Fe2+ or Zn2+ uptake regulation protein
MNQHYNEDFEDMFGEIRKELYKDDFFSLMMIEDVEKFLQYLKERLKTANDYDILSDILKLTLDDYQRDEVDMALNELSDKGLIRMVVDTNGRLAYEATDEGLVVNDMIQSAITHITYREEKQTNEIMDIKYSQDIYKVTGVDDGIKFVDHGDNYEFIVLPAGKQHDGKEMVQFYHTIHQDYHEGGPNGVYKLVDEVQLFDMLNNNYNQSK